MIQPTYNLFVIEELLREVDPEFQVSTALNGQIALNLIKQNGVFDIIFLDLNMPILNGYQVS